MKAERLKKLNNMPLQKFPKRAVSLIKGKESPIEITSVEEKSSITPNSLANRLFQKRISIDRKIENLRKLKQEEEMKEVQSKPKISVRSRKLALKVEKKNLCPNKTPNAALGENNQISRKKPIFHKNLVIKTEGEQKVLNYEENSKNSRNGSQKNIDKSIVNDTHKKGQEKIENFSEYGEVLNMKTYEKHAKNIIVDDINEIEEDIKLLEKCLSIDVETRKKSEELSIYKTIKLESETPISKNSSGSKSRIIERIKRPNKSVPREPAITPDHLKPFTQANKVTPEPHKGRKKSLPRRFIKKNPKPSQKSSSAGDLGQLKFNYRSLSPYHIQITRFNEF